MSSTSGSAKSNENLLSPRPKCRAEVPAEVVGAPHLNRAATRLKPPTYGTAHQESSELDHPPSTVQAERQLLRNMVVLGLGSALTFSALQALQSLQSSLFLETQLGLRALAVLYGLAAVSCLYGPAFVRRLTPNWTAVLAFVLAALYVSTFFYPRPWTLVPAAALFGLALGPLLSAQAAFLMRLLSRVACMTDGIRDRARGRHLRLFCFLQGQARVWGHLVAALLLRYAGDVYVFSTQPQYPRFHGGPVPPRLDLHMTPSLYATVARPSLCTLDHLSEDGVFRAPAQYVFYVPSNLYLMLVSVFLGLAFLGLATVTTLLDKFDLYVSQDPPEHPSLSLRRVALSLVDPQLRLMVPLIVFVGFEQGYMAADFTRSFVSCALGLDSVGWAMLCQGAASALGALAVAQCLRHARRLAVAGAASACQAGLLAVLWLWKPASDDAAVFYVIAAGWGLCHAVWDTLTTTYLTSAFTYDWQEPFAAYHLSQCAGLCAAFVLSPLLVNEVKVCAMASLLALALPPYALLEHRRSRQQKVHDRTADI